MNVITRVLLASLLSYTFGAQALAMNAFRHKVAGAFAGGIAGFRQALRGVQKSRHAPLAKKLVGGAAAITAAITTRKYADSKGSQAMSVAYAKLERDREIKLAHMVFKDPKTRLEYMHRQLLEYAGNQDADEKYQHEFNTVVQLFKAKGMLKKEQPIYLKVIGPQMNAELNNRGLACVTQHQKHFVHAHPDFLSDAFTPQERMACFAHELIHLALNQHPTMRILIPNRKCEEFCCDMLSTLMPGAAQAAVSLQKKWVAKYGNTNGKNGSHPYATTRIKYFEAIAAMQSGPGSKKSIF